MGDLDAYEVVNTIRTVRIEAQAISYLAHLSGDLADVRRKAPPELRHVLHCSRSVVRTQPGNQQGFAILKPRRFELHCRRFLHCCLAHFPSSHFNLRPKIVSRETVCNKSLAKCKLKYVRLEKCQRRGRVPSAGRDVR